MTIKKITKKALYRAIACDIVSWNESSGFGSTWETRFCRDMIVRVDADKAINPKMRAILDRLHEKGPQVVQNKEKVEKLTRLANVEGVNHISSTILDFAQKLSKGYELSEKQIVYLDSLEQEAESIENGTFWKPSDKEMKDMLTCLALARRYSEYYLSMHANFLKSVISRIHVALSTKLQRIRKSDLESLQKWFEKDLHELEFPTFQQGQLVFSLIDKSLVLVVSAPYVHVQSTAVSVDVLVNDDIKPVQISNLRENVKRCINKLNKEKV